jgi:hypothetical protein
VCHCIDRDNNSDIVNDDDDGDDGDDGDDDVHGVAKSEKVMDVA